MEFQNFLAIFPGLSLQLQPQECEQFTFRGEHSIIPVSALGKVLRKNAVLKWLGSTFVAGHRRIHHQPVAFSVAIRSV